MEGAGGPAALGGGAGSSGSGEGGASKVEAWRQTAAEIRDAIESHGWSDTAGAFTQSFDSDDLDASTLLLAITGFYRQAILVCARRSMPSPRG